MAQRIAKHVKSLKQLLASYALPANGIMALLVPVSRLVMRSRAQLQHGSAGCLLAVSSCIQGHAVMIMHRVRLAILIVQVGSSDASACLSHTMTA